MGGFEDGFQEVEHAAASLQKTLTSMAAAVKQLSKAARGGDLNDTRKTTEKLRNAKVSFDHEISAATSAWPFESAAEESYLAQEYTGELVAAATKAGVTIRQLGSDLIAFPAVIRVLPRERALLLNGKRLSILRPSVLVARLVELRDRKPGMSSERFLEVLHSAYQTLTGGKTAGAVALTRIYEALTLLPSSASIYPEIEFARDLCLLDHNGPKRTKSGAVVSLPASSGTRDQKRVYTFLGPDGEVVKYFGIQFSEVRE